MKIGIIQRLNANDIRAYSGTTYFMSKALAEHVGEVVHLGPDNSATGKAITLLARILNRISYGVFRRRISPTHHRLLAHHAARFFTRRIAKSGCDILYAPFASVEIARLATHLPIVYHTDLPWANAVDYYKPFSSLHGFVHREGDRIESAALANATSVVLPSEWAARAAMGHYRTEPNKVHIAAYGANILPADIPSEQEATQHSLESGIHLLWIGVDWQRKGGAVAMECLRDLRTKGVDARLTICGCTPPAELSEPHIEVIPFLDKRDPAQLRQLSNLFLRSTFFLFPTQADATPIVLSEAAAHGLPVLVRDTGGVAGAVREGVNGFIMPADAHGTRYADKIIDITQSPDTYAALVRSSRAAYNTRLNWASWAKAMKPIFEQAIIAKSTHVPT